jgi:hypothetical protein
LGSAPIVARHSSAAAKKAKFDFVLINAGIFMRIQDSATNASWKPPQTALAEPLQ